MEAEFSASVKVCFKTVETIDDLKLVDGFFRLLRELAEAKVLNRAQAPAFPIPEDWTEDSVMRNLCQAMAICSAARSARGDDYIWCQAIYLVCVCGVGGNLSKEQIKELADKNHLARGVVTLWNKWFTGNAARMYSFGNLKQIKELQGMINKRDITQPQAGKTVDPTDAFASLGI